MSSHALSVRQILDVSPNAQVVGPKKIGAPRGTRTHDPLIKKRRRGVRIGCGLVGLELKGVG
jgi:hypothetical protein